MVHDFGAPGQHLVPFVFEEPEFVIQLQEYGGSCQDKGGESAPGDLRPSKKQSSELKLKGQGSSQHHQRGASGAQSKEDDQVISHYEPHFCFLNLKKMKNIWMNPQLAEDPKESEWLVTKKIEHLTSNSLALDDAMNGGLNDASMRWTSPLFCRSSNWQKGIHEKDLNQVWPAQKLIDLLSAGYRGSASERWSTRFKIGFPVESDGRNQFQGYSIHEFLVTVDFTKDKDSIYFEEVQLQAALKS